MSTFKKMPESINGFMIKKDLGFIVSDSAKQKYRLVIAICKVCKKEFHARPTDLKRISSCLCNRVKDRQKNRLLVCKLKSMKDRCYNPNKPAYKNYGAKGITVCDNWRFSTNNFIDWAWENGYQDGLTIERLDNNKGYSPDNCIWIEKKFQARNSSKAKLNVNQIKEIKENVDNLSYSKLASRYNVNKSTIANILKNKTWVDVCI
ncbi:MAG TPA: hypothetical protein PKL69_01780 [Agitococcus sp.]|nr:hypothetical protein [Agitococcus sp.]